MTDKEKAELYYHALNTVLFKLENHSMEKETALQLKTYLIGYLHGCLYDVTKKESK